MLGIVLGMLDSEALREWYRSIGKRGGSATSEEKSRAARRNGAQGGRPRRQAKDLRELLRDENLAQWLLGQGLAQADSSEDRPPAAMGHGLAARRWQSSGAGGMDPWQCWTIGWNGPEAPSAPITSSLWDILEPSVPERYYLSTTACAGMLHRAESGNRLPQSLERALKMAAGIGTASSALGMARPHLAGSDGQGVTANSGEVSHCLLATGPRRLNPTVETFVMDNDLRTRSLTPLEYERLQGFPDNFTRIPWSGKRVEECPDTPRYCALGNSMAVPCVSWVGRRIGESHANGRGSQKVKYIHIFSGVSAASVAFRPLGWRPLAFSEIAPFASEVLRLRHPGVPNAGDMTDHDWSQYRGKCDLVVGDPPCQAFSVSGFRDSLRDGRGNLTLHFTKAVQAVRPAWVLAENVPGWLSTHDNAFGCFLAGLVGADAPLRPPNDHGPWPRSGVVSSPVYGAAWRVLDAQYFGVPQRRRRVFVIGHLGDWRPAAQALFEHKGADSAD